MHEGKVCGLFKVGTEVGKLVPSEACHLTCVCAFDMDGVVLNFMLTFPCKCQKWVLRVPRRMSGIWCYCVF